MNTRNWIFLLICSLALHAHLGAMDGGPVMKSASGKTQSIADSALAKLKYHELAERREKYLESGDKEMILKYSEQMVRICDRPEDLGKLTLEVADLYFDKGYLTEAEQYYSEFSLIFQGDEKAEYASYQMILCSFKRTYDFDRDQTKTEETIAMADKFLETPRFKTHTKEVEHIRLECYKKLAEKEVYVCDFYIKRGSLKSCERRLDTIKMEWLPKLPEIAPKVVLLENSIADLRAAKGVIMPVVTTPGFDESELKNAETTTVAQAKPGKHMADRF